MDNLERAKTCFVAALEHHGKGRLAEAEAQYREALALAPGRESVLGNLAAVLVQQHRYAEALALCEQALAAGPGALEPLVHAGLCHCELGDPERGLALIDRAAGLAPRSLEVHVNRAMVLQALGRSDAALAACEQAVALAPDAARVLAGRGAVLAALGRSEDALRDFKRALQLEPGSREARDGLFGLLRDGGFAIQVPGDEALSALAEQAITEAWGPPQAIVRTLLRLLESDPLLQSLLQRTAGGRLHPGLLDQDKERAALFFNGLFAALLRSTVLSDLRFERLTKGLRHALLERAAAGAQACSRQELAFHCALASQCFISEYVIGTEPAEAQALAGVRDKLEGALREGRDFPEQWLAAVACYQPLLSLAAAERLAPKSPNEEALDAATLALVKQQVLEPLAERALRDSVPRLTPIADRVSQAVRAQYEEHPYPRWVSAARAIAPRDLRGYLLRRFPGSGYRPPAGTGAVRALVAGCGTGQHPMATARRFAPIEVLAVDLSLASLCYARRKAGEMGVRNLRFAQADILGMASFKERFDLIESVGVLHHLEHPARGLGVLCSLLEPGGVMKLGLYSEIARREVVEARDYIASRGYTAADEDMRRCREDIMALGPAAPLKRVALFPDFYGLSECRDLLFHVQEHRYTATGLGELLAGAGLSFLGFELDESWLERYRGDYPQDTALNSLSNWHEFETRHPGVFSGMYQFWAQKPDG